MSLVVILARQHRVAALDVDEGRVALVNAGTPTVADHLITEYMSNEQLSLACTTSAADPFLDADFVIVAPPQTTIQDKITLMPAR